MAEEQRGGTGRSEAPSQGQAFRKEERPLTFPSMASRPEPDFTLDVFHRSLLTASVAVAVLISAYTLLQVPSMPEEVPIHWSLSGTVSYGSRSTVVLIALTLLPIVIGTAVLTRFPKIFNFPFELSKDNAQRQYRNAVQMLVWVTAALTVMSTGLYLPWLLGNENIVLVHVGTAVLVASMVFFVVRMYKLR
ncbi:DUF1648 domain-containing protein [Nesterenkonia populi]|uniref:DUF1648 domain-containing protein n=1 Tax=Nesterenkonia populi TaxID=1591087 RepID=UPI0011BF0CFE|nr:DUF1648 domain-containing protein [Nesterenkonia populi]